MPIPAVKFDDEHPLPLAVEVGSVRADLRLDVRRNLKADDRHILPITPRPKVAINTYPSKVSLIFGTKSSYDQHPGVGTTARPSIGNKREMEDGAVPATVRGVNPNPDRTGDDAMQSFVLGAQG
jgi:hypothetical protein